MKYVHIGWCRDGTADKVWGIIQIGNDYDTRELSDFKYYSYNNKYVTFWGRRGKKLQTKLWEGTDWDAKEMFRKKQDKGYQTIKINKLNTVYPEFQQDLEKTAVWAMLKA